MLLTCFFIQGAKLQNISLTAKGKPKNVSRTAPLQPLREDPHKNSPEEHLPDYLFANR